MKFSQLASALAAILVTAPAAVGAEWEIDGKHSSALFKVKHMMISDVAGHIRGIAGTVNYDGKNVDSLKVSARLDPGTIDTGDAGRDAHLKNADFFDVEKYPTITFESTGVVPVLQGGFKLGGKLTMHGVTKPVELTVDGPTAQIKDHHGKTRIGAAATTTVNRKDFGITFNNTLDGGGVAIGDDVRITLELELIKKDEPKQAADSSGTTVANEKPAGTGK